MLRRCCLYFLLVVSLGSAHASAKTIGILVYDGVLTSDVTTPLEVFGVANRFNSHVYPINHFNQELPYEPTCLFTLPTQYSENE